jgi:carbonic anhydrase
MVAPEPAAGSLSSSECAEDFPPGKGILGGPAKAGHYHGGPPVRAAAPGKIGGTRSVTDDLLANNARYAETFSGPLPLPPARHVAVVACMDARLNVYGALGLTEGEAHVIRNAGGVVTEDEVRSLAISQRLLGTREIILIHHTDCGMLTFTDDEFKRSVLEETGIKPAWSAEAFADLDEDVRQNIARIKASPFIPHTDAVRGFVFDVATGRLNEVAQDRATV